MVLQIFPTTSCKCCVKFEVPQCILQLNLHHQASKLGIKACNTQAKRIIIFYLAKIEMYMEIKINILQKASTQDPICWRVAEMSSAVKARIVSRQSSGTLRFLFFHKYKYTSHRFASGHVSFSFMDLNNSISETCSVKSYFCLKHGSGFKWAWFSFRIFSRAFPSPFGYSLSPQRKMSYEVTSSLEKERGSKHLTVYPSKPLSHKIPWYHPSSDIALGMDKGIDEPR